MPDTHQNTKSCCPKCYEVLDSTKGDVICGNPNCPCHQENSFELGTLETAGYKTTNANTHSPLEVNLAKEGTPLAIFQKERTDAITEMFDTKIGAIYPTSRFFTRLDKCVESLLLQARAEERREVLTEVNRDLDVVLAKYSIDRQMPPSEIRLLQDKWLSPLKDKK